MRPTTPDLTPAWLGPHIDEILDRGAGFVGMSGVTYVEHDIDDNPRRLIAADVAGIVLADWNTSDDVAVRFVPWREVVSVGVDGTDLDLYLRDVPSAVSFDVYTDDDDDEGGTNEEEQAAEARDLALRITDLMRRASR